MKNKKDVLILVNLKVTAQDLRELHKKAREETNGNLSELLRRGAKSYRAKRYNAYKSSN